MTQQISPGDAFEDKVREVACALWNLASGEGGSEFIDGDEIDCVCRTEDIVHLIECTIDRSLNKVVKQTNKLAKAKRSEERTGNTVKLWIVTEDRPTAEQRTATKRDGVTILTIQQFRGRLINAGDYLDCRMRYRFGSATNPETGGFSLPSDEYVPLPMTDAVSGTSHTIASIADFLVGGKTVILTGPFGGGKSLTVREVFKELRDRFRAERIASLPLALNLRDHWGQDNVAEAVHRHARNIGLKRAEQLVRAWNAGQLVVLLDGFDELGSPAWQVSTSAMKANRLRAVALVREFVHGSGQPLGLLIAGRSHYFDNRQEMLSAFGLGPDAVEVELSEFSDEQAQTYLRKKKVNLELPEWLPRKPLLLGYLATKGLLSDVLGIDSTRGRAFAWDQFITQICQREAAPARDIDAESVRRLLEFLASRTRESVNGTGPLTQSDLADAYRTVTGHDPLEPAMVLLGRLPGLTSREQEAGTRSFVDPDMLDSLRAGGVVRFIQDPYQFSKGHTWKHSLGELGYALAALKSDQMNLQEAKHRVAAGEAVGRWQQPVLALDCLLAGAYRVFPPNCLSCDGFSLFQGIASVIDLDDHPLGQLTLDSCWIELLRLPEAASVGLVLTKCVIERIEGIPDEVGVPDWMRGCDIGTFDEARTASAILDLDLPLPTRVLLTVIRKLFEQRGSGRSESALTRGLSTDARRFVDPILDILQAKGAVFRVAIGGHPPVWHPRRSYQARMREIASSPKTGADPILQRVRQLS